MSSACARVSRPTQCPMCVVCHVHVHMLHVSSPCQGYPTLKYFARGELVAPYEKARTKDNMLALIESKVDAGKEEL